MVFIIDLLGFLTDFAILKKASTLLNLVMLSPFYNGVLAAPHQVWEFNLSLMTLLLKIFTSVKSQEKIPPCMYVYNITSQEPNGRFK
jgi:hypothetical protein